MTDQTTTHKFAYIAVTRENGFSLGIATRGERGYHPTNYPIVATYEEATAWARSCNDSLGLTDREAADIQLSTF